MSNTMPAAMGHLSGTPSLTWDTFFLGRIYQAASPNIRQLTYANVLSRGKSKRILFERDFLVVDNLIDEPVTEAHPRQERIRHLLVRLKRATPFAFGVLAALLALMMYNILRPGPEQITANDIEETVAETLSSATQPPAVAAQVYQAILPSFVIIQTGSGNDEEGSEFGIGSGVIINDRADILTALHIVDGATEIQVKFADGIQSSAIIAAEQRDNDIAVLRPAIPPDLFLPATIGSLGAMRVGDPVFTVGNPFRLAGSMSAGVISGFERTFTPADGDPTFEGLIQFDASVNPGNSGGPLLNQAAQVIGIVTGLVNPTEEDFFVGIGFAVPIDVAAGAAGRPSQ